MPAFSGRAPAPLLLAALVTPAAAVANLCAQENDVFVHVSGISTSWRSAVLSKDGLSAEFQFAADNQGFFSLRNVLGDVQYHDLFQVGNDAILIQDGTPPLSGVALKLGCWQHNVYVGLNPRDSNGIEKETGPRHSDDVPPGAQRSLGEKRHGVLMKPKSFVRTKDVFLDHALTILVAPVQSLALKHWSQYGLAYYDNTLSSGRFLYSSVLFPLELANAPSRPWLNSPSETVSTRVNVATGVGGAPVLDCSGFQLHDLTHDVVRVSTSRASGALVVVFELSLQTTTFPVAYNDTLVYFRRGQHEVDTHPVVRMRAICPDKRIEFRLTDETAHARVTAMDDNSFAIDVDSGQQSSRFGLHVCESLPGREAVFHNLTTEKCNFNMAESPVGFWPVGLCPDDEGGRECDPVCESEGDSQKEEEEEEDSEDDYIIDHSELGGHSADNTGGDGSSAFMGVGLLEPTSFEPDTPSRDQSSPADQSSPIRSAVIPNSFDHIFDLLDRVHERVGMVSLEEATTAEASSAWETALPQIWSFATPLSPSKKVPITPTEVEWYVRRYLRKVVAAQTRAEADAAERDEVQDESPFVDNLSNSGDDGSSDDGQGSTDEA